MFRLVIAFACILFVGTMWAAAAVVANWAAERLKKREEEQAERLKSQVSEHRLIMSVPYTDETHEGPFWDCPDPRCFGPNRKKRDEGPVDEL